jgi:WD40 repeat protein
MNVAAISSSSSSSSINRASRGTPWPQRFFTGHTAYVRAVALDESGQLMASAQEGKEGVVRLWDFCSAACISILWGKVEGRKDCRSFVSAITC